MSEQAPAQLTVPVAPAASDGTGKPPRSERQSRGCLFPFVLLVLFASILGNLALAVIVIQFASDSLDDTEVREQFFLGDRDASDKVAVVKVDGVISEAGIAHPVRQLAQAAKDKHVKAIVLRVDSPGGSVSASDELYECIVNARDDTGRRFKASGPKPVVVSMGGVAASGGYYIAAAGSPAYAERTTITGSIGVFAALPNVAEFGKNNGVHVELIKAGDIKASGSFFHEMSQEERQTWQDTVDSAYDTFLGVIAKGRPGLTKEKLRNEIVIDRQVPERDTKGNPREKDGKPLLVRYKRTRADGGTFTAEQAKQFGLVDEIGDVSAAIRTAAQKGNLTSYRAVTYSKPVTFLSSLTGMQAEQVRSPLEMSRLGSLLTPRLWYLVPTSDGAIITVQP